MQNSASDIVCLNQRWSYVDSAPWRFTFTSMDPLHLRCCVQIYESDDRCLSD